MVVDIDRMNGDTSLAVGIDMASDDTSLAVGIDMVNDNTLADDTSVHDRLVPYTLAVHTLTQFS